jgi:hypothetical protein
VGPDSPEEQRDGAALRIADQFDELRRVDLLGANDDYVTVPSGLLC